MAKDITREQQQQERIEPQLCQAARDEADMGVRRIQRPGSEIAGKPEAGDHMTRRPAGREQARQRGSGDRMHHAVLARERGDECGTDEAAGAEDRELVVSRHSDAHRAFCCVCFTPWR